MLWVRVPPEVHAADLSLKCIPHVCLSCAALRCLVIYSVPWSEVRRERGRNGREMATHPSHRMYPIQQQHMVT